MSLGSTAAKLVVEIVSQVSKAVAGNREVADSLDKVTGAADKAAGKASKVSDAVGRISDHAGAVSGALGAIGAGLAGAGFDQAGAVLDGVGTGLDAAAGSADLMTMALETNAGGMLKAKAAALLHAGATKAAAIATGIMSGAQAALNAVMAINPVVLVVLAIAALAAGFIYAYKHSARFRAIVQAVGKVGKAAIGWVVDKITDLVHWVKIKAPAAWALLKSKAVAALRLITTPQRKLIELVGTAVKWVKDKLPAAFEAAKRKAVSIGNALLKPFRDLWGMIKKVIDAIGRIHLPKWVGGSGSGNRTAPTYDPRGRGPGPAATVSITVNGAVDPVSTARQIGRILKAQEVRTGAGGVL